MAQKRFFRIFVIAMAVILLFSVYSIAISVRIFNDSSKHLNEIYSQVNTSFNSLVHTNENLLEDWSARLSNNAFKNDEVIAEYFTECRERWHFTDFYFVDSNKNAICVDGKKNALIFDQSSDASFYDNEMAVIEGSLDKGGSATFFVLPVSENTYRGFTYSFIAISYDTVDMGNSLSVNAFGGKASCYIVLSDGTVLFSADSRENINFNMLDYLNENTVFINDDIDTLSSALQNRKSGTVKCMRKYTEYYITYQPVEFRDWMILGIAPTSSVNDETSNLGYVSFIFASAVVVFFAVSWLLSKLIKANKKISEDERDIKSRDRLFEIFSKNTNDIFIMFSRKNFKAEYITPNLEHLLGIEESYIRNDVRKLLLSAKDSKVTFSDETLNSIKIGGCLETDRELFDTKTGETRYYKEILYRFRIDDDDKYILLLSDRTEERQKTESLKQAVDIANSANKAKSNFLSSISHDLRTPMNAVVGFAALIEKETEDAVKVKDYSQKIMSSGKSIISMIDDVLDMSRIESGKASVNSEHFMMGELIDELAVMITPQANAKKHTFTVDCVGFERDGFIGDKAHISQILANLLSNAVKYTPKGGRITFTSSCINLKKDSFSHVRFEVADTGIGISDSFMKVIYDPFERDLSRNSEIKGTGLGLTITKSLVELMGGVLSVKSKLNEGTVFTVELDLLNDSCDLYSHSIESNIDEVTDNKINDLHILIAEDNALNAEIITELLEYEGAHTTVVSDGKELVELFGRSADGEYDIILMDIQMPKLDGYEATRAIRSSTHPQSKTIPIAAMTANAFADDIQKSLESGMNAHISKPIEIDKVKKVISELVRK